MHNGCTVGHHLRRAQVRRAPVQGDLFQGEQASPALVPIGKTRLSATSISATSIIVTGCILSGAAWFSAAPAEAQVFTVERERVGGKVANLTTFQPTSVALSDEHLTERTRQQLIRVFQSEQGFARRPLPLGTHGLQLRANGALTPGGSQYLDALEKYGISAKPGARVIISKFDIKPDRIVLEFNGGPDKHHRILQHVSLGVGMAETPLARDDGYIPVGSRLTLVFDKYVPELNPDQLRGLLSPMLDFALKTPVEAFADTLPPKIKTAVLNHEVLVGMNREMVINAVGQPEQKVRESDGQMPFEEWIYGTPPHQVRFVRFNGNRVIRLVVADVGQPPVIRDKDETDGYFAGQFVHQVRMGDAQPADPNKEHGPQAAPSLRAPGEALPEVVDQDHQLKPVQFPKDDAKNGAKDGTKPAPIPPPPNQAPDASPTMSPGQSPAGGQNRQPGLPPSAQSPSGVQ